MPVPNKPVAAFTFSPASAARRDAGAVRRVDVPRLPAGRHHDRPVHRSNAPTLTDFTWDFGDGARGNGVRVVPRLREGRHLHRDADRDQPARASRTRSPSSSRSSASSDPMAVFTSSPDRPGREPERVLQRLGVEGRDRPHASSATTGTSATAARPRASARRTAIGRTGTFVVTLTVTDDLGKTGTVTGTVSVGTPGAADAGDRRLADRTDRRPDSSPSTRTQSTASERQDDHVLRVELRRRCDGQRAPASTTATTPRAASRSFSR